MSWQPVPDWRALGGLNGASPDPYLIWARLTDWQDILGAGTRDGAEPVALLIELVDEKDAILEFRKAFETLVAGEPALLPDVYTEGRYLTVWVPLNCLGTLLDANSSTGKHVSRADLSMPVRASRSVAPPLHMPSAAAVVSDVRPAKTNAKILLGVIDSGCPFARRSLRDPTDVGMSTRIAAIWDMGPDAALADGALKSAVPQRMGYGLEVLRDDLNEHLARHGATGEEAFDEDACYADAGMTQMRSRASHGAHVLDLLAGPLALRQRVVDADSPPPWTLAGDAAANPAQTDIAFVQLPERALADSSGAWLGTHVLDAVSYLVSAAAARAQHALINLSYGCTVGPHDGSSILERALDAVVERGTAQGGKVVIAVAAGNSFGARGHAMLTASDFDSAGLSTPMTWRVLPGSETPSFMQVWLPAGHDAPHIRVTAPDGASIDLEAGQVAVLRRAGQVQATAIFLAQSSRGEASPMLLVTIAPTDAAQNGREPAPHGDWTVQVRRSTSAALASEGQIHAWIARNDHDIGMPLQGRQSYFVDPRDEPSRYLRGCADDPGMRGGEIDSPAARRGAIVRRRGTLNGIATGERLTVCAGYRLRDSSHAAYSSAGQADSRRGRGPSSAEVSDESSVMRGVRAGGNASGAVVRLVGTSTAAPQHLRRLASELVPGSRAQPGTAVGPPSGVPDPASAADLWGAGGRMRL